MGFALGGAATPSTGRRISHFHSMIDREAMMGRAAKPRGAYHTGKDAGHVERQTPPPPAAIIRANNEQRAMALNPLAYALGDPPPGRSALDQQRARMAGDALRAAPDADTIKLLRVLAARPNGIIVRGAHERSLMIEAAKRGLVHDLDHSKKGLHGKVTRAGREAIAESDAERYADDFDDTMHQPGDRIAKRTH